MDGDINFGFGVFHSAVLRARLRRRRKLVRAVMALLMLVVALVVVRPLLQGHGALALTNVPPDAVLTLDGQPLDSAAQPLSGRHTLVVRRALYYPIALDLTITRAQTTTLMVPPLRPRPAIQPIPLPAPGATWRIAMPDPAGGWRVTATPADVEPTPQANAFGGANTDAPAPQVFRLDTLGLTRLSVLEAYTAADELITAEGRSWAAWEPLHIDFRTESGRLTITTPTTSVVITTTAPVSGLWWAPGGRRLLIATQHGIGQELTLWSPAQLTTIAATPLVTVPGAIAAVHWSGDGEAVVVLSTPRPIAVPGQRAAAIALPPGWDATLIIPGARSGDARALRLAPPPAAPLGMVPLAWSPNALYWTAQDGPGLALERIPFAAALPTRLGSLPTGTIAVRVLATNQVRVLARIDAGALTMQTWPEQAPLFALDEAPLAPQIGGLWNGDALLLAAGEADLRQLTFAPETLR